MLPATLQFIIAMIACSINDRQQRRLDYAQEEVRVLKDILCDLGHRRIPFTADHRRRLAMAGKELSPEERRRCCQLVKPATLLAWFRQLGARKYDSSARRTGRPRKTNDIRTLVIEIAKANLGWGYTKIRDALRTGLNRDLERRPTGGPLHRAPGGRVPGPRRSGLADRGLGRGLGGPQRRLERPIACASCPRERRQLATGRVAGRPRGCWATAAPRPRQGLANALIYGGTQTVVGNGAVACRERLGGLLKFYHREAA